MPKPAAIRWLTHQRVPTADLKFRNLTAETRWLLVFAILYIGASAATGFAIRHFPMPLWGATYFTQDIWYVFGFKFALLLTLPLVVYYRWGYRFRDLLYGWRLTPWSAIVLVLSYALGFFINAARLPELREAYAALPPVEAMVRAVIGAALPFLMAGIPEEVVYRGMLQTRLEASWGRISAIFVSVVLFTAWHIPTRYMLANSVEGQAGDLGSVLMGTGLPVGIVAVIFALAWDRWRNLPALIAIHSGVDTIPIMCSMLKSTAESFR
jgi:membrane protease YdiL (CAAX protease family)